MSVPFHCIRPAFAALSSVFLLAASAEAGQRAIVLDVTDRTNVPLELLNLAQDVASRVYREAGVETVWMDAARGPSATTGEAGAMRPAESMRFEVILLSSEDAEKRCAQEHLGPNVLGAADRPAGRSYIFFARVVELAGKANMSSADLLGRVLAHEVGHLALRAGGHGSTGLMRAELDTRSIGSATFTRAEGAVLRHFLSDGPASSIEPSSRTEQ